MVASYISFESKLRKNQTDLMGQGVTKVVWRSCATWNAGVEHDDAIVFRGARIARGEGCVCEMSRSC